MDLEQLRTICLRLKASTESVKWENNLVFSVGNKMFCIADMEPPGHISLKVAADDFDAYTLRPAIVPAPYLAKASWIQLQAPIAVSTRELSEMLAKSHQLVAGTLTRKLRLELGLAE